MLFRSIQLDALRELHTVTMPDFSKPAEQLKEHQIIPFIDWFFLGMFLQVIKIRQKKYIVDLWTQFSQFEHFQ